MSIECVVFPSMGMHARGYCSETGGLQYIPRAGFPGVVEGCVTWLLRAPPPLHAAGVKRFIGAALLFFPCAACSAFSTSVVTELAGALLAHAVSVIMSNALLDKCVTPPAARPRCCALSSAASAACVSMVEAHARPCSRSCPISTTDLCEGGPPT